MPKRIYVPAVYAGGRITGNPYATSGTGYLVQLHCHTNDAGDDGGVAPAAVVAYYVGASYTALALTEHDVITVQPAGLVGIPACEYSPNTGHVTGINITDYARGAETDLQTIISGITEDGGVAILAHPNWASGAITAITYAEIAALSGFLGMEIHDAVTLVTDNYAGYAVTLWDQVLTNLSASVYGLAVDDFHTITDVRGYDIGRVVVFATAANAPAIMTALAAGNFVADVSNHGVTLAQPSISGGTISLSCTGAEVIRWIGKGGTLLQSANASSASYTVNGSEKYVRAEVVGSYTEAFGADLDWANRWDVNVGTWAVAAGILNQTDVGGGTNWLTLKRHIAGDLKITCDIRSNDAGGQGGIVFNSNAIGAGYYLRLKPGEASNKDVTLYKLPATELDTAQDDSLLEDTWYCVRIRYTASTGSLQARAWPRAGSEPETWTVEATDTTLTSGFVALRCLLGASFDNLYIKGFKSYYQPILVAT